MFNQNVSHTHCRLAFKLPAGKQPLISCIKCYPAISIELNVIPELVLRDQQAIHKVRNTIYLIILFAG